MAAAGGAPRRADVTTTELIGGVERRELVLADYDDAWPATYGEHALRAFDAQAVDYLMKPVDEDRLAATLDRVRQRLAERRSAEGADALV